MVLTSNSCKVHYRSHLNGVFFKNCFKLKPSQQHSERATVRKQTTNTCSTTSSLANEVLWNWCAIMSSDWKERVQSYNKQSESHSDSALDFDSTFRFAPVSFSSWFRIWLHQRSAMKAFEYRTYSFDLHCAFVVLISRFDASLYFRW